MLRITITAVCKKETDTLLIVVLLAFAFSFANEVPGVFENAKNADGFVKITDLKASHRTRVPASICEECRTVILKY